MENKIEISRILSNYMSIPGWSESEGKSSRISTLQDIDRTDTVFGGREEKVANGAYKRVIGGLAKEVIRAEAGIGFKWDKDNEVFTRKDEPLTEAEQIMLFDAVCYQLFKDTRLNEDEKKRYQCFLKFYLHQKALYQQSAKWLTEYLGKQDLMMKVGPYRPNLYFKDGVLYFHEVVSSTKLFDSLGVTQPGAIEAETLLKIELTEQQVRLTVQKFTVNYSPNLTEVLKPLSQRAKASCKNETGSPKKINSQFFAFFRSTSTSEVVTETSSDPRVIPLIKVH